MPKSKDDVKKPGTDPEVTRVVLIFLLLLVIIALLVAAFMSLGGNASDGNLDADHVIHMGMMTDENGNTIPTEPPTEDPNHNSQTDPIPDEILNPTEEETGDPAADVPPIETDNTIAPPEQETEEIPKMTAGGDRPAITTPVYMSTESELATLAPPLTTAGDGSNPTTITSTVAENNNTGGGEAVTVNYTVSLSGTAGIYAEPGGSSNGTVGSNGTFTIVQEKTDASGVKWGKLKSGAGWVRLN
ncbi:MAG: hypothetical protein K2O42_05135 [Oscillospiraceae bacterium]|nr:hypothetical protein [Oscillospiraceae bacterium]